MRERTYTGVHEPSLLTSRKAEVDRVLPPIKKDVAQHPVVIAITPYRTPLVQPRRLGRRGSDVAQVGLSAVGKPVVDVVVRRIGVWIEDVVAIPHAPPERILRSFHAKLLRSYTLSPHPRLGERRKGSGACEFDPEGSEEELLRVAAEVACFVNPVPKGYAAFFGTDGERTHIRQKRKGKVRPLC